MHLNFEIGMEAIETFYSVWKRLENNLSHNSYKTTAVVFGYQ